MGGLTRFDIFRIVVPGSAAVVLLDIWAKIIAATPGLSTSIARLPNFLERPIVGIAAGFALGILLYFVDLAYGAPQYYDGIPASKLKEMLGREREGSHLSLFFHVQDKMMPEALVERAALYGALYRLMFQLILFLYLLAYISPLTILILSKPKTAVPPVLDGLEVVLLLIAGLWVLLPFARELVRKKGRLPGWEILMVSLVLLALEIAVSVKLGRDDSCSYGTDHSHYRGIDGCTYVVVLDEVVRATRFAVEVHEEWR